MTQWQPIETAPRDGQPICVGVEVNRLSASSYWHMWVVFWSHDDDAFVDFCDDSCPGGWEGTDYSHWTPLPPPPVEQR